MATPAIPTVVAKTSSSDANSKAIFFVGWPERFHMAERYADEELVRDPELTDSDKILLASLRTQAIEGACVTSRPSIWDKEAMARWSSWRQLKNMSKPEAMNMFVRAVGELHPDWWKWPALGLVEESPAEDEKELAGEEGAGEDEAEAAGAVDVVAGLSSLGLEGGAPAKPDSRAHSLAASPSREAARLNGAAHPGPAAGPDSAPWGGVSAAPGWQPLRTSGLAPRAHYRHAAAVIGAQMYVFGGRTHGGRLPEGVRVLSLLSCAWTEPRVEGTLQPRWAHTMNAWRHMVVVFGGVRKREFLQDVALLDTHNLCWISAAAASPKGANGGGGGGGPCARAYHSAALVQNQLLVFGGEDGGGLVAPALHSLDLLSLSWSEPQTSGPAPAAVRDHVAVAAGSRMLLLGGCAAGGAYLGSQRLAVLETEGMAWSLLSCSGQAPSARAGHAGALLASGSECGWDLCLFGGGDGTRGFSDLFRLDLASHKWTQVLGADGGSGGELTPREGATCVCAGSLLLVLGGYTSTGCVADLFVSQQPPVVQLPTALPLQPGGGLAGLQRPEGENAGGLALLASADAQELGAAQEVFGRALQAAVLGVACELGQGGEWLAVGHDETYAAAQQKLELLQLQLERSPAASPARHASFLASCHAGLLPVACGGEERWFLFSWVLVQHVASGERAAAMSAGVQLSAPLVAKARASRFTRSISELSRELGGGADGQDVQELLTNRLMTMHAQLTEAWYSAVGVLIANQQQAPAD